ncbi:peptidoglycan-binding protein [Salicibibacter cibarius]|uniref:Peptidoglycan-binding protein n=1 Tax=Salicibibacter cibarius TaxID=2743000 RepID=A0A7T6Z6T5_9BACI|nr:peptidoglycan-binding protein [Salicibibacter cibarius]QQK78058.1 peptidoglycan-binding protein [Salicibibacter cibarius]
MKKYALSTVVAVGLLFAPNAADAFSVDADSMSEGDVNDSVNELQTELKDLGYFQGSTGSTFGPRTLSAVKAYQEDHGISSEAGNFFGVAGPQTIGSLEGSSSAETTSSDENSSSLSNGDTGEAVSDLQAQLQDLGYYDGSVDSIFGPQTESAVKAFQQDHGVSSPAGNFFGVAGSATLSALEGQPSENTGNSDNSGDNSEEESSSEDNASEGNASEEESSSEGNTSENNASEESSTEEDTSSEGSTSESESSNEGDGGSDNSGSDNAGNESDGGEVQGVSTGDNNSGSSDSGNSGDAGGVIDTAMAQMGTPYSYGANGPNAFDCSGFINYVLDQNGQGPDHRADTTSLYNMSTPVSNPSEGDLVFFDTSGGVSHAGIYIGNGEFIHASASNGVTIDSIDDPYYWGDKYLGAGSL